MEPIDPAANPKAPSDKNLTSLDMLTSYAPEGHGVQANLVADKLGVHDVIKGSFNNKGANTYPGEDGGAWVWTYLSIDLPTVNDGVNGDLRNTALYFELQTANCSPVSSIILIDENGQPSQEISFQNTGLVSDARVEAFELFNGWYMFTINLPLLFDADVLDNVSEIRIVFSNAFGNNAVDSIFYLDALHFRAPTKAWTNPTVYNHEGYYNKADELYVMFAGNSFIEFSSSATWFNTICWDNGANAYADYNWTPGGRIPDQYDNAFDFGGYMLEEEKPNVIFIQDFYALDDALALGEFLTQSLIKSPFTEVIVYTADNETEDGILAANHYGLDLVNWRAAIHTLKKDYGFKTENLHYLDEVLHANELSGVFGASMAYMQLYGEIPDVEMLWESILYTMGREDDYVVNFLPGETEAEKQTALMVGLKVCVALCGLDPDEVCLHQYNYEAITEATCESAGLDKVVCELCGQENEAVTRPLGHLYEDGECTRCDVAVLEEDGDYAHVNRIVPMPDEEIAAMTEMLPFYATAISTQVSVENGSAIYTKFIADGCEPMALDETSIGLFTTFLILDISNNDVGIALENSTLYFDLKLENCTPMLSLAFLSLAEEEPLALMVTLEESSNGINGFTFTQDGDWYRCALDFSQLEEVIGMSFVGMMFNIYSDSIHSESAFWLDNMTLDEAEIEDVEVDEDDLATPDILTTSIIADWNMHSDLVLQNKVVSTNSTSALRGSFNVADADDWYDSSNDPNGDGGPWVWTVVTLDLTEIFGCTVGLNGVA
ncbi:MAG: hypothetical protein IKD15_01805, partial [Clostridia bacterium]|nr:hypothetical protein [Clostridia bacterium]